MRLEQHQQKKTNTNAHWASNFNNRPYMFWVISCYTNKHLKLEKCKKLFQWWKLYCSYLPNAHYFSGVLNELYSSNRNAKNTQGKPIRNSFLFLPCHESILPLRSHGIKQAILNNMLFNRFLKNECQKLSQQSFTNSKTHCMTETGHLRKIWLACNSVSTNSKYKNHSRKMRLTKIHEVIFLLPKNKHISQMSDASPPGNIYRYHLFKNS